MPGEETNIGRCMEKCMDWKEMCRNVCSNKRCHKPDIFTVGVVLVITILCIIGITFIIIGASYLDDCALERHIPIYVLVQGIHFLLLATTLAILFTSDHFALLFLILCILGTFWFCWLITGSIWVFQHHINYHGKCHNVLFLFAFWTLIVQYIGLSIAFLASVIYCCFFCIMLWACVAVNG
ncbi:transmembrane protein 272-like isoform X2 [Xenopus laevis]|uniref:Transmembrane protein 272-like isoform X2 n=1 Tax=Xenopus laevis TaxID=8355 RepID=A0A8J1KIP7_XENLA|nr:transmembrane protein 272-like isoform X2 [Xenopus laevis]